MRACLRFATVIAVLVTAIPADCLGATIHVGQFTWNDAELIDPAFSGFTHLVLQNAWDDLSTPAPTLTNVSVSLFDAADGLLDGIAFQDLTGPGTPTESDQQLFFVTPAYVTASLSFVFNGAPILLSGRIDASDLNTNSTPYLSATLLLDFTPADTTPPQVPEPASIGLTAAGLALLKRRRARARAHPR